MSLSSICLINRGLFFPDSITWFLMLSIFTMHCGSLGIEREIGRIILGSAS